MGCIQFIIDGAIDAPGLRRMLVNKGNIKMIKQESEKPWSIFLNPKDFADSFVPLANQPPSIWTHEISLTPSWVNLGQKL